MTRGRPVLLGAERLLAVVGRRARRRPRPEEPQRRRPDRIGIWGLSEGAWVASLAASRSDEVDFLVVVGAAGMTPLRQTTWSYAEFLHHAGVTGSLYRTLQVRAMYLLTGLNMFGNADYDAASVWERVDQPVLALWGEFDREVPASESSRLIAAALERGGNDHRTMKFIPGPWGHDPLLAVGCVLGPAHVMTRIFRRGELVLGSRLVRLRLAARSLLR
jgi:Prolyl oligopeptidase family